MSQRKNVTHSLKVSVTSILSRTRSCPNRTILSNAADDMCTKLFFNDYKIKMKRILALLDSVNLYGKELSNIEVCKTLKSNDFDVVMLCNCGASKELYLELSLFKKYRIHFARNLEKNRFYKVFLYFYYIIKSNIEINNVIVKERPNYFLIPTEIEIFFLYPILIKHKNLPVIFRMGDAPISYRKKGLGGAIYGLLWKHFLLPRVTCIVSISNFIKEKLKESGRKDSNKDVVIYNYPPQRTLNLSNPITVDEGCVKIGYAGRIVPEKGVKELVESFINLWNNGYKIKLFIAGNIGDDTCYYENILRLIKKEGTFENIVFLGKLSNTDSFYHIMDIIVSPSIYEEPLGNVLVEAKIHHKPSIIFNRGGMPEIVEHKNTGYICPDVSVESLAEGIKFYLDNPDLIKVHGENAYKSIEELGLTKESYTEKWLKVFS